MSSSSSSNPESLKIDADEIRFSNQIGQGASGTVYKAVWASKYKEVLAAKRINVNNLSDKDKTMIKREIKILELIGGYPGITKLLGYSIKNGTYTLLFKFHKCKDLYFRIHQGEPLKETVIKRYTTEILQALQYMHSKGVVYSDLKADNVMLDCDNLDEEKTVLIDLGGACMK